MADTDRSSLDLDEIYEFAIKVGKEAGSMLMSSAQARFGGAQESHQVEKENAVDLVTQTDIGKLTDCVDTFKPAALSHSWSQAWDMRDLPNPFDNISPPHGFYVS